MRKLLISLDLDLKLDNAIISLALSFCYLEGNNVGHKIPVISTTFHTKQRICTGREERREETNSETGCYQRPNGCEVLYHLTRCCVAYVFLCFSAPMCADDSMGITESKMSTSSLSLLFFVGHSLFFVSLLSKN